MRNKLSALMIISLIALSSFLFVSLSTPVLVSAQSTSTNLLCRIFPFINSIGLFGVGNALCGTGNAADSAGQAAQSAGSLVQLGVQLIFIGIIIVAVFIIIRAALKYIRSEGDETKVKEAQKSIKTVFVGIIALFVGILGLVLVLAFFQAGGAVGGESLNNPNTGIQFLDNLLNGLTGGN